MGPMVLVKFLSMLAPSLSLSLYISASFSQNGGAGLNLWSSSLCSLPLGQASSVVSSYVKERLGGNYSWAGVAFFQQEQNIKISPKRKFWAGYPCGHPAKHFGRAIQILEKQKKQAFRRGHPARTSVKKLRSEKLRADFSFPISQRAENGGLDPSWLDLGRPDLLSRGSKTL